MATLKFTYLTERYDVSLKYLSNTSTHEVRANEFNYGQIMPCFVTYATAMYS